MALNQKKRQVRLDFRCFLESSLRSPQEETAGHLSSKACQWCKYIIKFLWHFWTSGGQKCHLMIIIGGPTWHLWLVTFVHIPFLLPVLLILAFKPILVQTIVTEGHYMLCSIKEFFIKSREELFEVVWQMTCQRSRICWRVSCWHHVFALLAQFALVHFKI